MKYYLIIFVIGIVFLSGCTGKVTKVESELQAEQTSESNKCQGKFEGIISRIIDGDTLTIEGCDTNIRLSLVDTPENYEAGYEESNAFTASLCKVGSTVSIDQDDLQPYDKYGRIVALVHCQNKNLNAELLANNFAIINTQFCQTSEFRNEEWAKDHCVPSATGCDSSYPTVCIPPSPPDLDCGDIPHKNFKVVPPDPHRFDGDKDGIGCEL